MKKKKKQSMLINLLGWYGIAAILAAYMLVSFSLVNSNSIPYQLLNLTGALGIIAVSYFKKIYQTLVLNIIWVLVAIIAIFSIIFK